MNLAAPFIRRPVMTTLLMAAIFFFGLISFGFLPVSELPNVDFPTISVIAALPGASAETMASSVATPLERQFSSIAGLEQMNSSSGQGQTNITLQFALDRDIDAAGQDVQAMIAKAARLLPPNLPAPPIYQKVNPADQPVLILTLASDVLPLSAVDDFAETLVAEQISMVSGVAQVVVYGSQKYAVRAEVDPRELAARGLGIDEVADAIANANVNLPTGQTQGDFSAASVQAEGQLLDAAAYRPLIVAWRNGAPVRLGELGRVIDSVENDKIAAWAGDVRSVILAVQRQPGTNTVKVVDAVKKLMPGFEREMPPSATFQVLYDRSESIRDSVRDVEFTLVLAVILVVFVIFAFLRNAWATIVPSLALPLAIVGTFSVMYLFGYSLDNLSLMALILCVGFVVDDAIVMLENIVRHMERGETAMEAALSGSKEVSFTILSMTLSLVAVFLPVLLMGGILGRLLHEFSVTITSAILVSGFVSLSLTPMLCSRFLRPPGAQKHGRAYVALERGFDAMQRAYETSLRATLRHRRAMLAVTIGLLVLTVILFRIVPMGFLPSTDTGLLQATTEAAEGTSFSDMVRRQKEAAAILEADPNVDSFLSAVGASPVNPTGNNGRFFIRLTPPSKRKLDADDVIQEMRPKFAGLLGLRVYLQNPPPVRIGAQFTRSQYQVALQGADVDELYAGATQLLERLRALPQLQDVSTDLQIRNPQVNVKVDRDLASSLGLSVEQVESALDSAYGDRQVSTILAPNDEYQVILELLPEFRKDHASLGLLQLRSSSGKLVRLDAVTHSVMEVAPALVNHSGQLPSVTLSFNLRPGVALADGIALVENEARQILPPSVSTSLQGTAQAFQSSTRGLFVLLALALSVIYVVLGILYESFVHPLTILSGLPSAGAGALLTLLVFGRELDVYAFVGVIMLVGIVKKNAIMMIDFALAAQRNEGKNAMDAILSGALVRFRPIMMTTMSALLGTLPIALGVGASGDTRRSLGLAVVGGLVLSQALTLYITPVVFTYLDALARHTRGSTLGRLDTVPDPTRS